MNKRLLITAIVGIVAVGGALVSRSAPRPVAPQLASVQDLAIGGVSASRLASAQIYLTSPPAAVAANASPSSVNDAEATALRYYPGTVSSATLVDLTDPGSVPAISGEEVWAVSIAPSPGATFPGPVGHVPVAVGYQIAFISLSSGKFILGTAGAN